jgi:hypothetical protein
MSQQPPRDKDASNKPKLTLVSSSKHEQFQKPSSFKLLEHLPQDLKGSPRDAGPFTASRYPAGSWGVYSDDCTHEVVISINGKFVDDNAQAQYCEWLADTLNRAIGANPKNKPYKYKPRNG